jgi:hypothetical protein
MTTCNHDNMQLGRGCCDLCLGGIEYCPECGYEMQLHELRCPNDPEFAANNPGYLGMKHWKDIPYRYRQPGAPSAESAFGLRFEQVRGGWLTVFDDGDMTPEGYAWFHQAPPDPAQMLLSISERQQARLRQQQANRAFMF